MWVKGSGESMENVLCEQVQSKFLLLDVVVLMCATVAFESAKALQDS
jgi:hypothetical protein